MSHFLLRNGDWFGTSQTDVWISDAPVYHVDIIWMKNMISNYVIFFGCVSVNSLSIQQSSSDSDITAADKVEFRWDFILIYCGLIFLKGGGAGMCIS